MVPLSKRRLPKVGARALSLLDNRIGCDQLLDAFSEVLGLIAMHLFAQRTRYCGEALLFDEQVQKRASDGPARHARGDAEFSNTEHYLVLDNLDEFGIGPKSWSHIDVARTGREVIGEYVLLQLGKVQIFAPVWLMTRRVHVFNGLLREEDGAYRSSDAPDFAKDHAEHCAGERQEARSRSTHRTVKIALIFQGKVAT